MRYRRRPDASTPTYVAKSGASTSRRPSATATAVPGTAARGLPVARSARTTRVPVVNAAVRPFTTAPGYGKAVDVHAAAVAAGGRRPYRIAARSTSKVGAPPDAIASRR